MLDRLVDAVRAGESKVLVLRGEPGVGKTALLDYLSDRVADWHIARAAGVESEMELAYAGLHLLCAPMLDHLDRRASISGRRQARRMACAMRLIRRTYND